MKNNCLLIYILIPFLSFSQVGIGTDNPQETLHVNGDLIVEGFNEIDNSTSLVGADALGNLTILNLDNQLTLENNRLELTRSIRYGIGDKDLQSITTSSGNQLHNLDLDMGVGEVNHGMDVINVFGTPKNIKLTGIKEGVHGQHLFFYHSGTRNIQFIDESNNSATGSAPENRIKVLAGSVTLSAEGSVEMLYDGDIQRWLILSIHD